MTAAALAETGLRQEPDIGTEAVAGRQAARTTAYKPPRPHRRHKRRPARLVPCIPKQMRREMIYEWSAARFEAWIRAEYERLEQLDAAGELPDPPQSGESWADFDLDPDPDLDSDLDLDAGMGAGQAACGEAVDPETVGECGLARLSEDEFREMTLMALIVTLMRDGVARDGFEMHRLLYNAGARWGVYISLRAVRNGITRLARRGQIVTVSRYLRADGHYIRVYRYRARSAREGGS